MPRLVQWMATLRCELSCPHCLAADVAGDGAGMADMPLDDAKHLIDQVADLGVEEFLITGGEPMVRGDLPAVIEHLGRRGVRYSVNTAVCPPEPVRAAMRKHPPTFAAVSLDGPREVHDRFRGRDGAFDDALAAIAALGALCRCGVAAGTTVTSRNFPHLARTFLIVLESGAGSWGIHLPVPEGRAAQAQRPLPAEAAIAAAAGFRGGQAQLLSGPDGRRDGLLRRLRAFGPRRAVGVRGGAGAVRRPARRQRGACTTLDRATSAGNVLRQPLAEIWRDGFAELRGWRPEGRCAGCGYAAACRRRMLAATRVAVMARRATARSGTCRRP